MENHKRFVSIGTFAKLINRSRTAVYNWIKTDCINLVEFENLEGEFIDTNVADVEYWSNYDGYKKRYERNEDE